MEQSLPSFAGVMNELKEAEIKRELLCVSSIRVFMLTCIRWAPMVNWGKKFST